MTRAPRMADIARLAGVSPMTVSRAFRQDASVSVETRLSIMRVAEDLGYVFDSTASNLRSQKTGFVAMIIPSLNNANFAQTVSGVTKGLADHGLQVLLAYTDYDIGQEERLIEQLLQRRPEAMILTGGQHTPRARRLLEMAGIPVVETWDLPADPIGHVVGFSNAAAARSMVDHLVATGYRRIAFIGGDADRDTRGADRRAGFIAAMQAHGLDATRLISSGVPPISMREGAQAMARLLDTLPDTEAVICVSDLSAFGALTECQRRGVAVPGRIAIGGFGDYEVAEVAVPALTTINPYPGEIGTGAAELLLKVLADPALPRQTRIITPALIPRQSSR
jgi:LacI family gluconate utilization system Gnt-I transcriptional repressor